MKKCLFVCDHNPFSIADGASQRTNVLLNACLANGFKIDIVFVGGSYIKKPECVHERCEIVYWNTTDYSFAKVSNYIGKILSNPFGRSSEIANKVLELDAENNYQYVVCRYINNAELAGLDALANKLLLDIDDLPEQSYKARLKSNASSSIIRKLYQNILLRNIRRRTDYWMRNAKACFVPGEDVAQKYGINYLPNIPVNRVEILDNFKHKDTLVFVGNLWYQPNINGINLFLQNVWHKVLQHRSDARLLIVGKGKEADIEGWNQVQNVKALGFVEDINEVYEQANIVVSPIYIGSGTNIKVLEALSMGKVCVMSKFASCGFENIVVNGVSAFVADNYDEFAKYLIDLLSNDSLCETIMQTAFRKSNEIYSQKNVNEIIARIIG